LIIHFQMKLGLLSFLLCKILGVDSDRDLCLLEIATMCVVFIRLSLLLLKGYRLYLSAYPFSCSKAIGCIYRPIPSLVPRPRSRSRDSGDENEPIQERFFRPHFLQAPGDLTVQEGKLCRMDCKVSVSLPACRTLTAQEKWTLSTYSYHHSFLYL
jgi:hypothetical protein